MTLCLSLKNAFVWDCGYFEFCLMEFFCRVSWEHAFFNALKCALGLTWEIKISVRMVMVYFGGRGTSRGFSLCGYRIPVEKTRFLWYNSAEFGSQ